MSSNNNNSQSFQIYEDNTTTLPGRYPSNQNNQFVLQPAQSANSNPGFIGNGMRVREAAGFFTPIPSQVTPGWENTGVSQPVHNTFDVNAWLAQNTPVGANRHFALMTPQQTHWAFNNSFTPQGNPVTIQPSTHGYNVHGNWHMGQLHGAINGRIDRPMPDVVPFWTAQALQRQDNQYRAGPPIPGTLWPTPAIGMTMHVPTIQAAQHHGMHINTINPQGHVQWTWQGRQ
jgi:hypothetical protein